MEDWNSWPSDAGRADRESMLLIAGLGGAAVIGFFVWRHQRAKNASVSASATLAPAPPVNPRVRSYEGAAAVAANQAVTTPAVEGAPAAPGGPAGPGGAEGVGGLAYLAGDIGGLAIDGSLTALNGATALGAADSESGGVLRTLMRLSAPIAMGLSYATYKSIPWALVAGFFGPTYLAYRGFQHFNKQAA